MTIRAAASIRVLLVNIGAGSNLKVKGHIFTVPPLFCSDPQFEGALRTPGWAQSCAHPLKSDDENVLNGQ